MYPRLLINLSRIRQNAHVVAGLCASHGLKVVAVTKVFRAAPPIARAYLDAGLTRLGDSRTANLKKLAGLPAEKWLIRPPMLSEVPEMIRYADVSLNSEFVVLEKINEECLKQHRSHKVVLMADLGDIREGYTDYDELVNVAQKVEAMDGITLYGLGTNLTCFSFIQSDPEKMRTLASLRQRVEQAIGRKLDIISGGNSATIDLMLRGGICPGVDSLRLGESLLFGKERSKYTFLPGTKNDAFILQAEIVELKEKPSLPWGTVGVDSYGHKPSFTDRGPRRLKAVCALGKQDFDSETTFTIDPGVLMLGASSDHLMLDVTDSQKHYRVGDVIELKLGYFSTMRAFTSEYVEKVYLP